MSSMEWSVCVRLHLLQEAPSRLPSHHNRGIVRKEESSNPCRPAQLARFCQCFYFRRHGDSHDGIGVRWGGGERKEDRQGREKYSTINRISLRNIVSTQSDTAVLSTFDGSSTLAGKKCFTSRTSHEKNCRRGEERGGEGRGGEGREGRGGGGEGRGGRGRGGRGRGKGRGVKRHH